jgi:hypothetical protein
LQTAGREKVNRSSLPKKLFEGRTCFRSSPKNHALYRLRDFRVVFQSSLQSIQYSVTGKKRNRNKWVSSILCGYHGRNVSVSSKIQVDILPLEISSEIELPGIHGVRRNRKFSLGDDPVTVRKRVAGTFSRDLKSDGAIVDAGHERNKSLDGAELIDFWFAQDQQSDGVFIRVKKFLVATPVSGIGSHLVSMPKSEKRKRQETGEQRGGDLP